MDEGTARWRAAAARAASERPAAAESGLPTLPAVQAATTAAATTTTTTTTTTSGTATAGVLAKAKIALGKGREIKYVPTNVSLRVAQRSVAGHEAGTTIVLPEVATPKDRRVEEDVDEGIMRGGGIVAPSRTEQAQMMPRQSRTGTRPQNRRVRSRIEFGEPATSSSPPEATFASQEQSGPTALLPGAGDRTDSYLEGKARGAVQTPTMASARRLGPAARPTDSPSRGTFIAQSGTPVRAIVDSNRGSQRPTSSRRTKPLSSHRPSHLDGVASMLPWNNPKLVKKRIPIVSEAPFRFRKKRVSVRDLAKAHQRERRDRPAKRRPQQQQGESRVEVDVEATLVREPEAEAPQTGKLGAKTGKPRPPTLNLSGLSLDRGSMPIGGGHGGAGDEEAKSGNQEHGGRSLAAAKRVGSLESAPTALGASERTDGQAALPFIVTESGSLNIQGFEIQESGITRAPSGVLPSPSTRDGLIRLSVLGRGASGVVHEMLHEPTFSLVAVKSIPCFEHSKRQQMIKEIKALYANLVPIRTPASARKPKRPVSAGAQPRSRGENLALGDTGAAPGPGPLVTPQQAPACQYIVAFHDAFVNSQEGSVNIVMEYMDGGSLQDVVNAGGCDSEDVLSVIAENVARGLLFLHNRRQIHRDIKPSNLLLNGKGEVKISDFGIVRDVTDDQSNANTFVGTMVYMSPERINGEPYSFASDIWSLGLTLMTCALGTFPFAGGGSYWDMLSSINNDPIPQLPAVQFSDAFADLVNQCLCKDPAARPTAAEILRHPFVAERVSYQLSPLTESVQDPIETSSHACKPSPDAGTTQSTSPRPESSPARPGSARTPSTASHEGQLSVESKDKIEEICAKLVEYQLSKNLEAHQRRSKAHVAGNGAHGSPPDAEIAAGIQGPAPASTPGMASQATPAGAANFGAGSGGASTAAANGGHAQLLHHSSSGSGLLDDEEGGGAVSSGANAARRRKRLSSRRRSESTPSLAEMGKCSCSFKGNKCSFCITTTLGPQSQRQLTSPESAAGAAVPFYLRKYTREECAHIAHQIGVDAGTVRQRVNSHIYRANEFLRRSRLYAS